MVEMWFKPTTRYSAQSTQSAETNSGMFTMAVIAAAASIIIGILGPKWAINLDYTQASEKNVHIINTAHALNIKKDVAKSHKK